MQPWLKQRWCIPERDLARFVAALEEILDLYAAEHTPEEPLVCMDEAGKQLLAHVQGPLPLAPGRPVREDYHYQREGVRSIFMFFDPVRGWRRTSVRVRRTREDWAHEIRRLLDEDYPHARKVKLVCDNLNTHHVASLYHTFPAAEAHRLARRLEIHYTPKHGSWLNVAEIELSVLGRDCLDRRIAHDAYLVHELVAWNTQRNQDASKVVWRFRTEDARYKLRHLYPQV